MNWQGAIWGFVVGAVVMLALRLWQRRGGTRHGLLINGEWDEWDEWEEEDAEAGR